MVCQMSINISIDEKSVPKTGVVSTLFAISVTENTQFLSAELNSGQTLAYVAPAEPMMGNNSIDRV